MNWKTLVKTPELQTMERDYEGMKVRIEARLNADSSWTVIKRYYSDSIDHTEQFSISSQDDLNYILRRLQIKNLGLNELKKLSLFKLNEVKVYPKREFKEYNLEKWSFSVNNGSQNNLVFMRFTDSIDVDIYLFDKYKCVEDKIINEINSVFGLDDGDIEHNYNIYYFTSHQKKRMGEKKDVNWLFSQVDDY